MSRRLAALRAALSRWERPAMASVRDAWLAHERYRGQLIATSGVVRSFEGDSPDEYFVLDDGPHRIGLRGDVALLRAHLDRPVTVTGRLTFKPGVGIFLEVATLVCSPGR